MIVFQRVSGMPLIWFFVLALWAKLWGASRYIFDVDIESYTQEAILVFNTLGSSLLLAGFSLFGKRKNHVRQLFGIQLAGTVILYINVLYYRFFNDFITIPVLLQTGNAEDLGSSLFELIRPYDFLFFIEFAASLLIVEPRRKLHNLQKRKILLSALAIMLVSLGLAHKERPQLLTRSFDRKLLVKNLGVFPYHLYDLALFTNTKARIAMADNGTLPEIINYTKAVRKAPNPDWTGLAKGKNVFLISLESTQGFVVDNTVNGHEITPFFNQLKKEKGSVYFSNFYHQTGQGKTSDSEFIIENSLYGLPRGAVFFSNPQNEYNALPEIVKKNGYYTAVFHANNKSFWNRDLMYKSLGYERFFSEKDYLITKENSIGWGLKDDAFFEQSIGHLKNLPQPFYAKFITLTNHFPFTLEKKDEIIPEWISKDGTVNRYFTTVRYQDEALRHFFERLKAEGLYENSIFIVFGDHYGISDNHNKAMSQFLQKKITPYEYVQLQRVPLLIHIPELKQSAAMPAVAGQIDIKPTLLNLLGVENVKDIEFGSDVFASGRTRPVILRDGSFVSDDYVYTANKCYRRMDGKKVKTEMCRDFGEIAKDELQYSDRIIYGNLLKYLK